MSSPNPVGAPFALSSRILAASLMGALVVMGVALSVVLPPEGSLSIVVLLAQVVVGVVVHGLLDAVGYRMPAPAADLTDDAAEAQSRTRWQSGLREAFGVSSSGPIQQL